MASPVASKRFNKAKSTGFDIGLDDHVETR